MLCFVFRKITTLAVKLKTHHTLRVRSTGPIASCDKIDGRKVLNSDTLISKYVFYIITSYKICNNWKYSNLMCLTQKKLPLNFKCNVERSWVVSLCVKWRSVHQRSLPWYLSIPGRQKHIVDMVVPPNWRYDKYHVTVIYVLKCWAWSKSKCAIYYNNLEDFADGGKCSTEWLFGWMVHMLFCVCHWLMWAIPMRGRWMTHKKTDGWMIDDRWIDWWMDKQR